MNIFTKIPKITTKANQENYFPRTKDGVIQLYKGSMQDFTWKTTFNDTNRTLRSHHYISIDSWRKYINGITVINSTQVDLDKMVDEFISHKIVFNTAHIIKSDIQHIKKKLIAYSKSNRMTYVITIPCVLCPVE